MAGNIAEFLALSLFACIVIAAVLAGKTFAGLLRARTQVELVKTKTEVDRVQHIRQIQQHDYSSQVLALTEGEGKQHENGRAEAGGPKKAGSALTKTFQRT